MVWNKIEKIITAKLIGSAGSLPKLLAEAKKQLYTPSLRFLQVDQENWTVHNDDGEMVQYHVKMVRNRFRLESTGKDPIKRKKVLKSMKGLVTGISKDGITIKGDDKKEYFDASSKIRVEKGDKVKFDILNNMGFAINLKVI